ncbi:MAG: hypothetical protein DMF47_08435 [Verrucomicrobia bacterium]|nr:MAG: hypothetical protein DMF47_08435 [Verrucomicrobiota bacterium]
MFLRISRLVDRKFIAQQRSIIFFVPKLTPCSIRSSNAAIGCIRAMAKKGATSYHVTFAEEKASYDILFVGIQF